jgi:hypothetical protein
VAQGSSPGFSFGLFRRVIMDIDMRDQDELNGIIYKSIVQIFVEL